MSTRTLTLAKGVHKYLFRYASGCERHVVDELMRLADDPQSGLSWLDAATLSYQVAQSAAVECKAGLAAGGGQEIP